MSGHITLEPEMIEAVRIRILRLMDRRKLTQAQVASAVGRSPSTVCHFLTGRDRSSSLAVGLVQTYPEIALEFFCPACGQRLQRLSG